MSKLDIFKKLAKLGGLGAATGAVTMTPEEAQGAGISTIMRKLGVTERVAQKIKEIAASSASRDEFERKLQAIKKVREHVQDPQPTKIGSGADVRAYDVGDDQILKVPRNTDEPSYGLDPINPAILEKEGIGAATTTVETSKRPYHLQEKLSIPGEPKVRKSIEEELGAVKADIVKRKQRAAMGEGGDILPGDEQAMLAQATIDAWKNKGVDINKLENIYKKMSQSQWDELKDEGIYSVADIRERPDLFMSKLLEDKAFEKTGRVLDPFDIHNENVGVNLAGEPKIIDTSRFGTVTSMNITPEQKKAVFERYAASPQKKQELAKQLEEPEITRKLGNIPFGGPPTVESIPKEELDKMFKIMSQQEKLRKVGAVAGAVGAGTVLAPTEEAEAGISGISRKVLNKILDESTEDGTLNLQKVADKLEFKPPSNPVEFDKNRRRALDLMGHAALEKTGKADDQVLDSLQQYYPELDIKNIIKPNPSLEGTGMLGQAKRPGFKLRTGKEFSDPSLGKIEYMPSAGKDPESLSGLLMHESQHVVDPLKNPDKSSLGTFQAYQSDLIKIVKDNPNISKDLVRRHNERYGRNLDLDSVINNPSDKNIVSLINSLGGSTALYKSYLDPKVNPYTNPVDYLSRGSKGHHTSYPENYEMQKLKEIQEKGIITPTPAEVANMTKNRELLEKRYIEEIQNRLESGENFSNFEKFGLTKERYKELTDKYLNNMSKAAGAGAVPLSKEEIGDSTRGKVFSAQQGLSQGLTFGFGDEIAGAFEAGGRAMGLKGLGGPITDIGFSKEGPTIDREKLKAGYYEGREAERERNRLAEEANPKTFMAGDIAGSIATPGAMIKGAKAVGSTPKLFDAYNKISKAKKAAVGGAAYGALEGAGRTDAPLDSPEGMAEVGLMTAAGGVLGPVAEKGMGVASDYFNLMKFLKRYKPEGSY